MSDLFTLNEVAAIAEVPSDTIRTALEKKSVAPSHTKRTGRASRLSFSEGDILLVKVLAEFPFALSQADKHALAQLLSRGQKSFANWSISGTNLLYRSGNVRIALDCKRFRQVVN